MPKIKRAMIRNPMRKPGEFTEEEMEVVKLARGKDSSKEDCVHGEDSRILGSIQLSKC